MSEQSDQDDLTIETETEIDEFAQTVAEIIDDKPEYEQIFKQIIAFHENDYDKVGGYRGPGLNTKYTPINANRLRYLKDHRLLELDPPVTNSRTVYLPTDIEAIRRGLKIHQKGGVEATEVKEFEPQTDLDELFTPIVGYDDIKERFRRAIRSRSVRQSILLTGPRASSKTLFLREVMTVGNVARISGGSLTAAGLEDLLIERPAFVIIDEFNEIPDPTVYSILLHYQDAAMPYTIRKHGKQDDISVDVKAPVFASANATDQISEANLDRFWRYTFSRYSNDEYQLICQTLLPDEFGITADLAEYIAHELRGWSADASIRDAERIAEVTDTKTEVNDEIGVLEEYSDERT